MSRPSRRLIVFLLLGCIPATAETLRCRSINGNVTCAGDGAASCQMVNSAAPSAIGSGQAAWCRSSASTSAAACPRNR